MNDLLRFFLLLGIFLGPPLLADQSPNLSDNSNPVTDEYKNFIALFSTISVSPDELRLGRIIFDIKKQTKLSKVVGLLNELTTKISNYPVFLPYEQWASALSKNWNLKSLDEKLTDCKTTLNQNDPWQFKNHYEDVCHATMLEYIKNKQKLPLWGQDELISFLMRKPQFYFSEKNLPLIKKAALLLKNDEKTQFWDKIIPYFLADSTIVNRSMLMIPSIVEDKKNSLEKEILTQQASIQQKKYLSKKLSDLYATTGKPIEVDYKKITDEIIAYTHENKDTLGENYFVPRLIMLSDFLIRNNEHDYARKTLNYIKSFSAISENDYTSFHFNYLWSYITQSNFKDALKYASQNNLLKNFGQLETKLQYWIADAYFESNQVSKANDYFEKIIAQNSISFYGIMALKRIKSFSEKKYQEIFTSLYNNKPDSLKLVIPFNEIYTNEFKRIALWSKLGSYNLVEQEFDDMKKNFYDVQLKKVDAKVSDLATLQFFHSLAVVINAQNSYLSTFRIMAKELQNNNLKPDSYFLQTLFPTPFENLIKNNKQDIDNILLFSLIRQESGFDPKARSQVGALGLMQLMPYTARRLERGLATSQLSNPEKNVLIGTKYLKKLLTKYENNLVYTLAAYNAGDTRVNNWQKVYFKYDSILYNIESIPYEETKNYVKLILRNMFFYKLIHEKSMPDTTALNEFFDMKLGFNK